MATTKRSKGGRATPSRAKTTARAAKSAKPTPKKKTVAKAKPGAKARLVGKPKPVAKAKSADKTNVVVKAKSVSKTKPARGGADGPEVVSLKAKFNRERNGLEKRLTEAVREIGLLRHHELRAMQLERQVAEREATIERLQAQLADLERRPAEPVYVHEVQQSLALGAPAHQHGGMSAVTHADLDGASADLDHSAVDLDEFEDERLADDADLVSDDD